MASVLQLAKILRDSGDGCNLCLRSWSTPNPNVRKRATHPSLPKRSERSNACSPCTQNVYNNYPTETARSLEQKLKSGDMSQDTYDESLENYEKGINGQAKRTRRAESAESGASRQIMASQGKELGISKNLGVFWPVELWDSKADSLGQSKADKKEIQRLPTSDGMVTGVTRDKSFGEPAGTYTLTEKLFNMLKQTACVADTKYQEEEDFDATWAAVKKRKFTKSSSVNVGTEQAPVMVPKVEVVGGKKRSAEDFSLMDSLFDSGPPCSSSTSTPAKKQSSAQGWQASSSGSKRNPASASKALNQSEAVALAATQFMRTVNEADAYDGLVVLREKMKTQLDAVSKRLVPELSSIYSAEVVPGAKLII